MTLAGSGIGAGGGGWRAGGRDAWVGGRVRKDGARKAVVVPSLSWVYGVTPFNSADRCRKQGLCPGIKVLFARPLKQAMKVEGEGAPVAGLDPSRQPREFTSVEKPAIKILGQLHTTPWQRFVRLQRTAARLARGRGQPKGVFRFATYEACTAWTANLSRSGK